MDDEVLYIRGTVHQQIKLKDLQVGCREDSVQLITPLKSGTSEARWWPTSGKAARCTATGKEAGCFQGDLVPRNLFDWLIDRPRSYQKAS